MAGSLGLGLWHVDVGEIAIHSKGAILESKRDVNEILDD